MAASGLGITLVNELMARDYAHMPVAIRPLKQQITHSFALAHPKEVPLSEAARLFGETTAQFLQTQFHQFACFPQVKLHPESWSGIGAVAIALAFLGP